jgi:5-methylcytosine-specific restriction endonuclease McrA
MGKYYITNGDRYLGASNDTGITLGVPVTQAKRFKYEAAYSTLPSVNSHSPGWTVQKYYNSASNKNYVITNATKFVGDNDKIVPVVGAARGFKTAADADGYIRAHGSLMVEMGTPLIVNEGFELVDILGRRTISKTTLKQISLNRANEVKKTKRVSVPKDTRLAVYQKDNGICQICGRPVSVEDFTVDHIVPLNRGGINDISNYRCVCKRCNLWKSDSLDEEMVRMLEDVGSNYVYKHPESDMATKFVRMMVRGVINKGEHQNIANICN